MTKSEGAAVREAYDGPEVEHDDLINQFEQRIAEEYARSSDSSESASKTNTFLEKTALNSQAFSWGKSIMKKLPKKDGQSKAMDIIRSLKVMLPMIENHVAGQGTGEMDLEGPQDEAETDEDQELEAEEAEVEAEEVEVDADLEEDTAEFEEQADQIEDDTVTPIDFGGAA